MTLSFPPSPNVATPLHFIRHLPLFLLAGHRGRDSSRAAGGDDGTAPVEIVAVALHHQPLGVAPARRPCGRRTRPHISSLATADGFLSPARVVGGDDGAASADVVAVALQRQLLGGGSRGELEMEEEATTPVLADDALKPGHLRAPVGHPPPSSPASSPSPSTPFPHR